MSVHDALDAVAGAQSPSELFAATAQVRREIRRDRARFASSQLGNLAQTYHAAMQSWDAQKADGVPRPERMQAFTASIRAAWPFEREWKYVCDTCQDLGLEILTCHSDACGRTRTHSEHTYGVPCFCPKGQQFREKPNPSAEDFTQAGKAKSSPRGFTKFGR